jgi:hypothetical protein
MAKKVTMKQYETSKADKTADKGEAKAASMPVKAWEKTKGDAKADKAQLKRINK